MEVPVLALNDDLDLDELFLAIATNVGGLARPGEYRAVMNGNWYHQQQHSQNRRPPVYQAPTSSSSGAAVDAVHDAHRLLSVYPFASATPTNHVARHLSGLSLTAIPPSYYVQPAAYNIPSNRSYQSQYSEYSQEVSHLASSSQPYNDGGYWESQRNEAIRHLGQQGSYSYDNGSQWSNHYSAPSSYQPPAFAQSVLQHTAPSTAYPTPPPPGIRSTSSSLAMALGEPVRKPVAKTYTAQESPAFFDNFLAQQTADIKPKFRQVEVEVTPRRKPAVRDSSPDHMTITPRTPDTASRKRKAGQMSDSPLGKKVFTSQNGHNPATPLSVGNRAPPANDGETPTPRQKLQPYVELPPVPKVFQTPSRKGKGKMKAEADDDLGGFVSPSDDDASHSRTFSGNMMSSGRRATGDRDERAPLDKFTSYLEDIFEAEDALPPDIDPADLPADFFSPLSSDSSHPRLSRPVVTKLIKLIVKASGGRSRQGTRESTHSNGSPKKSKRTFATLDTSSLSRVLRLLERSVKAGEDVDPFKTSSSEMVRVVSKLEASPKKPKAKKQSKADSRRSKSATPHPTDDGDVDDIADTPPQEVSAVDLDILSRALDLARESLLATECCLTLLSSDRLQKQLYSEELITTCLSTVKNQLTKIIYPFVEASAESTIQLPPLLYHVVQVLSPDSEERRLIAEIFHSISSIIPRINDVVSADSMSMSEGIVIQAVYVAIGPFFVVEGGNDHKGKEKKGSAVLNTLGSSAMRGLRLDALALIRGIFANYEDQRGWIIEEILTSLIKLSDSKQKAGQFKLRDGRSIRTVSALLMQLVQTSAHDVRVEIDSLRRARQADIVMRRQDNIKSESTDAFLDEKDMQELRLYTSGLDSATKAAKTIIVFLTHRSGKTKSTKNANEAEYRTIFDNFIADLLTVLFWPEWPAAAIILGVAARFMVSSLDDVKSANQNENNAAKTMALDHLGVIAARLRPGSMRAPRVNVPLSSVDENFSRRDSKGLAALMAAHRDILLYLCRRSSDDQAYESAWELTVVMLGQELAISLKQCARLLEDSREEDEADEASREELLPYGGRLKEALQAIWDDNSVDVFDAGTSTDEIQRIDHLADEVGMVQGLRSSFNPILNTVISALEAQPVFMRTKALKALGQIITSDPEILSAKNVRSSIEAHLLDSSPAVRDAAVELIGKYIIESHQLAEKYYKQVADRIQDTGLGVRKRVLKLFKPLYGSTDDRARKIDICVRIVQRMGDEDETVRELAIKTLEELWFSDSSGPAPSGTKGATPIDGDKSQLLMKVSVIMGTSAYFRDRNSPLEDLLHKLISQKEGSDAATLHRRYGEICEVLIDGLVDDSDLPGFSIVNCVRTICLFTAAYPVVLTANHVSTLLPYLKNAAKPEDQLTCDYLLRIYRASIPHLPKTALKFGQDLQLALQPMIVKPSPTAGITGLQETVACLCAIVQHVTHEYRRLVALVKSCSGRLQQTVAKPANIPTSQQDMRALPILVLIVALLCEHCNFDALRDHADLSADLDAITKGPITEHMYFLFLKLYNRFTEVSLRTRVLQCLGFLFRAQPSLLTAEPSSQIMDAIFASEDEEAKGRLLKIMQEFLTSEADKHAAKEKNALSKNKKQQDAVNMDELVGNTDGFAESGVSSAIVQRYIESILSAALSPNVQMQAPAVEILAFTIKQGLAHPLQCFPVVVALETSHNNALSGHANHLHGTLHSKHTSLLNTRYVASARASFHYQKKLTPGAVQGYRMAPSPTALLHRWYTLVREKRTLRQDFLKALVKVFDVETPKTAQDDVDFARYMAENFATFDYRTQEEVLSVLKYLTSVLSTTGMQLVEAVSPSHLLKQLHESLSVAGQDPSSEQPVEMMPEEEFQAQLPVIRSTVVICIIMSLKAYLKTLYGVSEEKISKFVMGKKSAVGDRPAQRRHERPLCWDNLPAASNPILTSPDLVAQRKKFLEIWSEDGVNAEPEDDFIME